jgi:hypothetical protein
MPEKIYQEGFYENIVRDGLVIPSLKRVGIKLKITRVTMHPFILKDDQPSILMKKGESALFLRRIGFDERDHPILVIEHTMNGAYSDKLLSIQTVH